MWCGLPNATILWLLLSPLELGGGFDFSINPLISPKDLFVVTQVTQGGSRTQLAVALLDLLTVVSLEEKIATRVRSTGVCSLIPLLCAEEELGGLLTFMKDKYYVLLSLSSENTSRTINFPGTDLAPENPREPA